MITEYCKYWITWSSFFVQNWYPAKIFYHTCYESSSDLTSDLTYFVRRKWHIFARYFHSNGLNIFFQPITGRKRSLLTKVLLCILTNKQKHATVRNKCGMSISTRMILALVFGWGKNSYSSEMTIVPPSSRNVLFSNVLIF